MNHVIQDLPFLYAYIKDVLIASSLLNEHEHHVTYLFTGLVNYGLVFSAKNMSLEFPSWNSSVA